MKSYSKTEWVILALTLIGISVVYSFRKEIIPSLNDEPVVEDHHNSFAELQKRDEDLTHRQGTRVTREDNTLHVKIAGGKILDLQDCDDCGPDKEVEYYLVDDSAHGILIYRQYYEGDDIFYVAPDGQPYDLPGWPVFAPSGKSYAIVSDSERIGHSQVDVWTFNGNTPLRVFQQTAQQDNLYRLNGWDGEEKIHLEETQMTAEEIFCVAEDLIRTNGSWALQQAGQKKSGACSDKQDWLPSYLRVTQDFLPRAFTRKFSMN